MLVRVRLVVLAAALTSAVLALVLVRWWSPVAMPTSLPALGGELAARHLAPAPSGPRVAPLVRPRARLVGSPYDRERPPPPQRPGPCKCLQRPPLATPPTT